MDSKTYIKVCEVCGSTFKSKRSHSTVCGNKCRLHKHKNRHISATLNEDKEYRLILHTHVNAHIDLDIAKMVVYDRFCSESENCLNPLLKPDSKVYIKLFRHFDPLATFIFLYELVDKTVSADKKKVVFTEGTFFTIPDETVHYNKSKEGV
jgi:hypothetical protein